MRAWWVRLDGGEFIKLVYVEEHYMFIDQHGTVSFADQIQQVHGSRRIEMDRHIFSFRDTPSLQGFLETISTWRDNPLVPPDDLPAAPDADPRR